MSKTNQTINFVTIVVCAFAGAAIPATSLAIELYTQGKSKTDLRADSVVRCHYQVGEFGAEAIDLCVQAEDAARAELAEYPDQYSEIVRRCNLDLYQAGWTRIKRCVDEQIAQ
ncbi:MAG: hypothetical protein PVH05_15385, partial [Burkholderiales bacterium]